MDIPGTSQSTQEVYNQWAQIIECPICYNIYDKPMQMGCGHTLCVTCVGRLVDQVKNNHNQQQEPDDFPRIQLNFNDANGHLVGLGGNLNEQLEEAQAQWIEVPRLDAREPPIRGFIGIPPPRRRDPGNGATEIKCPECRKPTVVPLDGLPINYRVQEIVQKVSHLFKDRHLVKNCGQCKDILAGGLYFVCETCGQEEQKICSVCSIRHHNGHTLVEKKALTSEDVRLMKQKINDASARAFQALELIKPPLSTVGGHVEQKVNDKLSGLIKIFEFMISTFDSKIKDNSTVDELMAEVKKAEQIATVYEQGRERVDEMMRGIEQVVVSYWDPFEKLQQEMEFEVEAAPVPAPTPVPVAPNPHAAAAANVQVQAAVIQQQLLDHFDFVGGLRPRVRAVGQHNAQVDRMRQRNRHPVAAPQPNQIQHQQRVGPPAQQMPNQFHHIPWIPPGQMGQHHLPINQQMAPQFRAPHRPPVHHQQPPMQQQPQQMQQQPLPQNMNLNPDLIEFVQAHLRPPAPPGMRLNERNIQLFNQQQNQNVPLPPQMPNFAMPQPVQHHQHRPMMPQMPHHPQAHQHPQQIRWPPPHAQPPPPPRGGQMYFPNQNFVIPHVHVPPPQQPAPQQIQQQQQVAPMQILPQPMNIDEQVPQEHEFPEPQAVEEMAEPRQDQQWVNVNAEPFEIEQAEEEDENDEQFDPNAGMAVQALEMIRAMPNMNIVQQGPLEQDDLVVEPDVDEPVIEQPERMDAEVHFRFPDVRMAVDELGPEDYRPEELVPVDPLNVAPFPPPELVGEAEFEEEDEPEEAEEEAPEAEEEEEEEEEEEDDYQPEARQQRAATVDDAETRRQTRRSLRTSLPPEEGANERNSSSPAASSSSTAKRRRMERSRQRAEQPEPEPMDSEENSMEAIANRPPKRRAATASTSGASTSGSSSSAPTTRRHARS